MIFKVKNSLGQEVEINSDIMQNIWTYDKINMQVVCVSVRIPIQNDDDCLGGSFNTKRSATLAVVRLRMEELFNEDPLKLEKISLKDKEVSRVDRKHELCWDKFFYRPLNSMDDKRRIIQEGRIDG